MNVFRPWTSTNSPILIQCLNSCNLLKKCTKGKDSDCSNPSSKYGAFYYCNTEDYSYGTLENAKDTIDDLNPPTPSATRKVKVFCSAGVAAQESTTILSAIPSTANKIRPRPHKTQRVWSSRVTLSSLVDETQGQVLSNGLI